MQPAERFGPAVGFLLLSTLGFACMDTISKILVQTYAITQILSVRYVFFLGFVIWVIGPRRLRQVARSHAPWLLLPTALLLTVENGTFILAYRYLPLADVQAIAAAAPLIVVALSVPVLGEIVGIRRWLAVLAGFAGVLLIVRPGFAEVTWQTLIPVAGALQWGLYQVLVRKITRLDSSHTTVLWMAIVGVVSVSALAPLSWTPPDAAGWGLLLVVGLLGSMGHLFLIKAVAIFEASRLQPYAYSQLVWSVLLGYLVFSHVPDVWVVSGAVIIIAGGLYAWYRQQLRGDAD